MQLISYLLKEKNYNYTTIERIYDEYGLAKGIWKLKVKIKLMEAYYKNWKGNENGYMKLLKDIRHVKGRRIIFHLPLNGQRTHTNARTTRRLLKIF